MSALAKYKNAKVYLRNAGHFLVKSRYGNNMNNSKIMAGGGGWWWIELPEWYQNGT